MIGLYRSKLDSLGYILVAESIGVSSTTFTWWAPKATEFGEIAQNMAVTPFKVIQVTDFGTNP